MKNLRLIFFAVFLGCFVPVLSYGQGIFIPARTVFGTVNGITRPISGATVTVCGPNASGTPCSPPLANTVFKDSGLTVPLSNPFTTDANGNYPQVAVAGGVYTVTESAAGFAGFSYQMTVSCAAGAPCTITGPFNVNGSATITGALTAVTVNTILNVCNATYACTDAGLQAAQNALTSGGTIMVPPGSTLTISNPVNITNAAVTIMCNQGGLQVANTGDVFNVTANTFHLLGCNVGITTSTARTGAIVHASTAGGSFGLIRDLVVTPNGSSTNNGLGFLADAAAGNIVEWNIDNMRFEGGNWTSEIKLSDPSGSNTDSTFMFSKLFANGSFTDAPIVLDGALDTVQIDQAILTNFTSGGKVAYIRNTVGGFINPRFIYFNQVSAEALNGPCLQVDAGRQVHYYGGYCAASGNGFIIGASAVDTDVSHVTIASIQHSAITIANGALNTLFTYNTINDTSQALANTDDVVSIAANTTDVSIIGNTYRCPSAVTFHNAVTIAGGTGTRIKVINNDFPLSCIGTTGASSGASGADVQIYGNGDLSAFNSRLFLGAGEISQGETAIANVLNANANQDNCAADSNLHGRVCADNGSVIPVGTRAVLTADWTCGTGGTVASCVAATIIGSGGGVSWTFSLPAMSNSLQLDCDGVVGQATAATANQWNLLTATNGATNVTATYDMYTAATAKAGGAVTDQGSTTTTFQIAPSWTLGGTGTKMPFHIHAAVQGASASGTVLSVQLLAPTVGDLVTIFQGSGCWVHP